MVANPSSPTDEAGVCANFEVGEFQVADVEYFPVCERVNLEVLASVPADALPILQLVVWLWLSQKVTPKLHWRFCE
jgi:hypothetical protein